MEKYSILAKALDDVLTQELDAYLATVDFSVEHKFSAEFELRMERLIKRRAKPYYKLICTAGRRAVCVAAAVMLVLCFAMSFESVRAAVKEFFTRVFSDHIVMEVHPEYAEDYPDMIEEVYEITELPEGFVLVDSKIYSAYAFVYYERDDYYLNFTQRTYEAFRIYVDNENMDIGVYVDNDNQEYSVCTFNNGDISVIWSQDGYIFTIDSNLDKENVLDLCTSLKVKK